MDDIFKAIANAHRRKILKLLSKELTVSDLLDRFHGEIAQPTLSTHLSILKKVNLIKSMVRQRERVYSLDEVGILKLKYVCEDLLNHLLDIQPRVS